MKSFEHVFKLHMKCRFALIYSCCNLNTATSRATTPNLTTNYYFISKETTS